MSARRLRAVGRPRPSINHLSLPFLRTERGKCTQLRRNARERSAVNEWQVTTPGVGQRGRRKWQKAKAGHFYVSFSAVTDLGQNNQITTFWVLDSCRGASCSFCPVRAARLHHVPFYPYYYPHPHPTPAVTQWLNGQRARIISLFGCVRPFWGHCFLCRERKLLVFLFVLCHHTDCP